MTHPQSLNGGIFVHNYLRWKIPLESSVKFVVDSARALSRSCWTSFGRAWNWPLCLRVIGAVREIPNPLLTGSL